MTPEYGDDNWMENDVLLFLDQDVDPYVPDPEWMIDLETNFEEGWANLERGAAEWMLTRFPQTTAQWERKFTTRKERLDRLKELNAPRIILLNEQRMVYEAAAGYAWSRRERVLKAIDAMKGDGDAAD